MKFHVTLEHGNQDKEPKKSKTQPKPSAPAPSPAAPPKKTTSNKNVSPPTQGSPKGASTAKKAPAKNSSKGQGSAPKKAAPPQGTRGAAGVGQKAAGPPQAGPLLGSRWPQGNPPGNPMAGVKNQKPGQLLPPTPPKEPPPPPISRDMRARQSTVLKARQKRELAGNSAGAPRDVDAGAGFWPPLSPLL